MKSQNLKRKVSGKNIFYFAQLKYFVICITSIFMNRNLLVLTSSDESHGEDEDLLWKSPNIWRLVAVESFHILQLLASYLELHKQYKTLSISLMCHSKFYVYKYRTAVVAITSGLINSYSPFLRMKMNIVRQEKTSFALDTKFKLGVFMNVN